MCFYGLPSKYFCKANCKYPPETTLQRLLNGNKRLFLLKPTHPHATPGQLMDAAKEQHPFSVIVCCFDSRVPPELIFDTGIGDLFVIRTAGNIIDVLETGSVEYAIEHLGVKQIVVLGHENCGTVQACIHAGVHPGHINDIVNSIGMESEIIAIPISAVNRLDDCIKANVNHGIRQLMVQSVMLNEKVKNKQVNIIGMRYDLDDLNVTILNQ